MRDISYLYDMLYPKVVEHFEQRGSKEDVVVHVINIDIQDNQEEATIGTYLPRANCANNCKNVIVIHNQAFLISVLNAPQLIWCFFYNIWRR